MTIHDYRHQIDLTILESWLNILNKPEKGNSEKSNSTQWEILL